MESLKRRFVYTEAPPLVDIYYGTGTTEEMTAYEITTLFSRASGFIGSTPSPRLYTFGDGFNTYRFFAIPDLTNIDNNYTRARVIMSATDYGDIVLDLQPGYPSYSNYQLTPTPPSQSVQYALIDIYGVSYRLYRTASPYTGVEIYKIYSFPPL